MKVVLTFAVAALLAAVPAYGRSVSAAVPSISASCLATGGSTIHGTLVATAPGSLTMTVERGRGRVEHSAQRVEGVDQPVVALQRHRHADLAQPGGVGLALVPERVELGRRDERRGDARQVGRAEW